MRRIPGFSLWLGRAGDARNAETLFAADVQAVVDLAAEETPALLPRDFCYIRIPLVDGAGNSPWLLQTAVQTIENLIRGNMTTLVCCGAGMSRAVCLAGAAVARIRGCSAGAALEIVTHQGPADVSPGLWAEVVAQFVGTSTGRNPDAEVASPA